MRQIPLRSFVNVVSAAAALTVAFGTIYATVQQSERQSANDPQIQMAEEAVAALEKGRAPAWLVPAGEVDLSASLAPVLIIYDANGKALAGNAQLNGKTPGPPSGVFDYARIHREDRVTWQPDPEVRIASVIMSTSSSRPMFVLAGRSLREVEKREQNLTYQVTAGWAASLVVLLLTAFL